MSKLLVESFRLGRSDASATHGIRRRRRNRLDPDGEGAAQRVGMRRDTLSRKSFGEHLGPLFGYLRQQVHRPWSKVYSELCAQLDRRSVVQAHLFQHIADQVEMQTFWRDEEVWVRQWWRIVPLKESRAELFVHPRTGILLPNRARVIEVRRQRQQRLTKATAVQPDRRVGLAGMAPNCQWHRIGGIWYEVTLAVLPAGDAETRVYDVLLKRDVSAGQRDLLVATYGPPDRYARTKRQLDRRTLRRQALASEGVDTHA